MAIVALAVATAAAQEVRSSVAMRPAGDATAPCGTGACNEVWSAWAPSGAYRARVLSVEDAGSMSSSLVLVVDRGGERWMSDLGSTGELCGGTSGGVRSTSFLGAELVDFAGGPEAELFVDTRVWVHGEETTVNQIGTIVCSLEGVTPSCHAYVGGERSLVPRSFGPREHVVVGASDFTVQFIP